MDGVLEDVKLVKIDIPFLDVIKQLLAYATLLKKFCTQIEKSWTHISTMHHCPASRTMQENCSIFWSNIRRPYIEV